MFIAGELYFFGGGKGAARSEARSKRVLFAVQQGVAAGGGKHTGPEHEQGLGFQVGYLFFFIKEQGVEIFPFFFPQPIFDAFYRDQAVAVFMEKETVGVLNIARRNQGGAGPVNDDMIVVLGQVVEHAAQGGDNIQRSDGKGGVAGEVDPIAVADQGRISSLSVTTQISLPFSTCLAVSRARWIRVVPARRFTSWSGITAFFSDGRNDKTAGVGVDMI